MLYGRRRIARSIRLLHSAVFVMACCMLAVTAASAADLLHRYSFGSDAGDSIGTADGTLENGAVISAGALVLDGVGAFVDLPNGLFSALDDISVETWLTDNNSGTWARIYDFGNSNVGEGNSGTGTEYMFLTPQAGSGALRGAITASGGGGEQMVEWPGTRLPSGVLTHVVWTYDSAGQTGRLFVDGTLVAENTGITLRPSDLGGTVNNWIGRSQWSGDPNLNAEITEFRIYDAALTATEVLDNYTFGPDVLALSGPVALVQEPASQTVEELDPVTFTAAYRGTPPVSVQWYRGGAPITGATNDSYTIASVALTDHNAVFRVVVSNTVSGSPHTATSSNAVLSVITDFTPPVLVRASSVFPDGVLVEFSEGLSDATAVIPSNYLITHAGGSLAVTAASFSGSTSSILLATAPQTLNRLYTLTVNNLRDRSNASNLIAANSQATFAAVPYLTNDIGSPPVSGFLTAVAGGFDFTAAGTGLGGADDQLSFSHKTVSGDFDIQIRLAGLGFSDAWARAGLMARDGLAADARFAASFATAGPAGCQFAARLSAGATPVLQGFFPASPPDLWLRLRRTGNLFEGFAGLDGQRWQRLGSATITLPVTVEVGMALMSGEAGPTTTTAQFRDESAGSGTVLSTLALPFEPMGPSTRRSALVISEIMYDAPADWGGTNSLEFVELWNSGLVTEDLTGHRLSGEISYTFPGGTRLAPGEFLVVAADPAAAQGFYGVNCLGPYTNKLANNGGTLRLRNELDGILLEVEYDSRDAWPVAAAGAGHSLVLSHPSYGEEDPRAWSPSDIIGGSPGAADPYGAEPARGIVINEFLAHTDDPAVDYIELFNPGTQPVDLSGAWLSDAPGTNKYRIADGAGIPAGGFLSFDQNQLGFALSADGEQIFLVNAARTRVLDAVEFRGQANGVTTGRYPDGAPGFQELLSVTRGTANTRPRERLVVINEIMYHPISESDNDEYLELYNRSVNPLDLSNWRIQGGVSYQFPSNTVIAGQGYLIVAENATNLLARYPQLNSANTYGNYGGVLSDGGERIALAMPEDLVTTNGLGVATTNIFYIVVDEVTYRDGGRWGQWSDGGGSSLELIDPDADNRLAASWADSDESAKADWTAIDTTHVLENGQGTADRFEFYLQGAGEVLVDDLEFRNNGGNNWVSNADFSSGSGGWTFGGVVRNSYVESGVGIGGSAALHLVSTARGDAGANQADRALDNAASTGGANTGTIRAKVRWLKGSPYILLRPHGHWMEASLRLEVPPDCGTPGLPNSRRVSNAGPALYDVVHGPILPAANEAVVVTARATDPDGIQGLTLHYRIDPSTSYGTAPMYDNGSGGDARAGDGIYSATISGRSSGTLAAFYVSASDGSATSQFPATAPDRECLVRWGESALPGGLGTYRLWLTAANIDFWNGRERNANDLIDATFVYGNHRVVYNVGTMYSASPFHTGAYDGPLGSFPCDYEINFQPGEQFLGSEPFVLSGEGFGANFWFDNTTQIDLISTWIARKLGQQYNYRRHVNMRVNGSARGMIYLDSQQPNGEMLNEYFPNDSDGQLRKVEDWFEFTPDNLGFTYITATIERFDDSSGNIDAKRYRWNWRPRAMDDHDQWFVFTNMIAAVNDTGASDYESRVRNWVDIPNFLRPVVVNHIVGNWDSYGYERGKNMYAYKPDDQGWRLLPWDIELALGKDSRSTSDSIYSIHDPMLSSLIQNTPAFHREYLMAFQEAVDGPLMSSEVNPILDERYENLVANGIAVSSPVSVEAWISARRSYLQGILPTAAFAVDGPGSISVSQNLVVLTGSAPLTVYEILVNGVSYPIQWTGITAWQLEIPVTAGPNTLMFVGVDRHGDPVAGASDSVTVTYTGADLDPEGVVVINEIHPSPEAPALQFVELYNTDSAYAFDLSGWRINGLGYQFPAGSFLPPLGYLVLVKDPLAFSSGNASVSVFDAFDGKLDPDGETLTLLRPGALPDQEIVVDRVRYEANAPWPASAPGSSLQLVDATRDNSRVANWDTTVDSPAGSPQNVVAIDHTWKYSQTGDLGIAWRQPGYNDSLWPSGRALLYVTSSGLPAPKNTSLTIGQRTYYFRTTFTYSGGVAGATLDLSTVVDDGFILYLNGQEIYRLGVAPGTVIYDTLANRTVGSAQYEGPFTIPATALVQGENILAVEVHQATATSSDIVLGMTLDVTPGLMSASTPGAANSVTALLPPFPDVWLNELQADNVGGLQDNFGEREPWVELYNAGAAPFSLNGYYLTDDYANPTRWAFPAGASIPAGGFILVWCDAEPGETTPAAPHTDFALGLGSGRVALARITNGAPQVVDYLNYTNLPSNWSYGDVPDGQPFYRNQMFYATPQAINNGASPPLTVFINEWMADNAGTRTDPADGSYEDWFELSNPGTNTADLGGYFLTDDLADPFQFEIPDNGHYTIPAGGYLLVWADNEPEQNSTNRIDLHVNFALGKGGDAIGLFGADGTAIDSITFGAQTTDVSEGRFPDGAAAIFSMPTPTPRQSNVLPNAAPVLDPMADRTLTLGQTLSLTAAAADPDLPPQSLTFSLNPAPPGAAIHPTSGLLTYTPDFAPGTNTVGVVVTDNGTPNLSATQSFTVTVVPAPILGGLTLNPTDLQFSWPSVPGQAYQVYYKDDIFEVFWNPIGNILVGTGSPLSYTNVLDDADQRYFSIGLTP